MHCASTKPSWPRCGRRSGRSSTPIGPSTAGSRRSTRGCAAGPGLQCAPGRCRIPGPDHPQAVRRPWTRPSAPIRGDRGTAAGRRPGGRALVRRPPGRPGAADLWDRGAARTHPAPDRRRALLLRDRHERTAGGFGPGRGGDPGHPHRRRLGAQRPQGVDQRRASGAPGGGAGPDQPAGSRTPARRASASSWCRPTPTA